MSFRPEHELHTRRFSRNLGVGIALLVFVALIYGVTVVKARENGITGLGTVEASQ